MVAMTYYNLVVSALNFEIELVPELLQSCMCINSKIQCSDMVLTTK